MLIVHGNNLMDKLISAKQQQIGKETRLHRNIVLHCGFILNI